MSQQLTEADRAVLAQLLELKVPKTEIAQRLHKHRSSIYRELARNTGPVGYIPQEAQQRTDIRRWVNHRVRKMHDPRIRRYVCQRLKRYWSPDQIAGRLRRECRGQPKRCLSRQTIYEWVHRQPNEERRRWRGYLRFGVSRRRRRENGGQLPNAVRIDGRPKIVASRRRYGDWEGDTIVGRGHSGGLVSLVERKSGFTLLARVRDRRAELAVGVGDRARGQVRREPSRLGDPVRDDARRRDDEERVVGSGLDRVGYQRQRLDGLTESHVVRQDPAESELPQRRQPFEPVQLVWTE